HLVQELKLNDKLKIVIMSSEKVDVHVF
ncbi:MAG: hypothetical protein ACJAXB_001745, partial [Candidatus Endobugula sp.]